MNYFKMIGFYFCEVIGTIFNFLGSLVGVYMCLDLGVRFLLLVEGTRITQEQRKRFQERGEKEQKADSMHKQAKDNG